MFKKNNLTIKGVGGRAKVDAAGKNAGGKGIWVIQGNNTTIENVELSGCAVADKNGAGIRQEGNNLTLRNMFFHDNENGILGGGDATSTLVIEDSEFARNGAGDGYSHNMYIAEIKSFTLRGSYSHNAKVGHLVKSRAHENVILYNRLTDETGTASYEIDLPQGGKSYVIGNIIQQSSSSSNGGMVAFAKEGKNPDSVLFVVNNTFFNSRGAGTFISIVGDLATPTTVRNNIFSGPGTMIDQSSAIKDSNFVGDAMFVNAAGYDYHLKSGSPALDKGVPAGTGSGRPLEATCQYVHPAHAVVRKAVGVSDLGGFELGGETTVPCGGSLPGPTEDAGPPADGGTIADGGGAIEDSGATPPVDDAGVIVSDSGTTDPGVAPSGSTEEDSGCAVATPGRVRAPLAGLAVLLGLALAHASRKRD